VSWYVGKIETVGTATIVLMILLSEVSALYRRLGSLATIDALTGLSNRQAFDNDARFAIHLHERSGEELSFLVVDIDFFKQYNDTYGHQAGDECLRQVAASIRCACGRTVDLVGRFGGEEFVALLPGSSASGALLVGEAIRGAVEALAIPHAASAVSPVVTVSVGISELMRDGDARLEQLFSLADAALYRAKRKRNTVVMDGAVSAPIDIEDCALESAQL
jgi:diguanylate cyclase (GGDEF)-like protein